jgi:predicted GIY-YIG superfamily endonuclease
VSESDDIQVWEIEEKDLPRLSRMQGFPFATYSNGFLKALVVGSSPTQPIFRDWLWVRVPPNPSFASMAWVYILRGSCGRYYIGSTENLDRRLAERRRGKVHSTRRFGEPLELITAKEMPDIDSARELERELKAKKNTRIALYLLGKQLD